MLESNQELSRTCPKAASKHAGGVNVAAATTPRTRTAVVPRIMIEEVYILIERMIKDNWWLWRLILMSWIGKNWKVQDCFDEKWKKGKETDEYSIRKAQELLLPSWERAYLPDMSIPERQSPLLCNTQEDFKRGGCSIASLTLNSKIFLINE